MRKKSESCDRNNVREKALYQQWRDGAPSVIRMSESALRWPIRKLSWSKEWRTFDLCILISGAKKHAAGDRAPGWVWLSHRSNESALSIGRETGQSQMRVLRRA
ncbi:MAG: hypothetical protein WAV47_22590 [Blastocatellia bacterium]